MKYNLLEEAWIPVRRRSGDKLWVRPDQVVEPPSDDPIVSFAAPRPDFNAALMEFMIGLLQTSFAPADIDAWYELYKTPPTQLVVKDAFARYSEAFELIGDGPRFLQDYDSIDGVVRSIDSLLTDAPADNTLKLNKDHFIKRIEGFVLGPAAAALALFTLQSTVASGGQGHRTSMRGGGPWMTTLRSTTLWKSIWMNVIDQEQFEHAFPHSSGADTKDLSRVFPWLAPTRTSEPKTGTQVHPTDASPLQAYWGMPRRISLKVERKDGVDTLYQTPEKLTFRTVEAKNYGVDYGPEWRHPLTPYRFNNKQEGSSIKGSSHALSFRHWSQYTFSKTEASEAALVVRVAQQRADEFEELSAEMSLFACGYDMDNMKARCWYEGQMPFFNVQNEYLEEFELHCNQLLKSFQDIAYSLYQRLKYAQFGSYVEDVATGKKQWKMGDLPSAGGRRLKSWIEQTLESRVESLFYETARSILDGIAASKDLQNTKEDWLKAVGECARNIFDEQLNPNSAAADYSAIARARGELRNNTSTRNNKLRSTLNLAPV